MSGWLAAGLVVTLLTLVVLTLVIRHRHHDLMTDPAPSGHLEKLRAQSAHVERLANRMEREQANNHFRIRVEKALRGQS